MVIENGDQEFFLHAAVVSPEAYRRKPPEATPDYFIQIPVQPHSPFAHKHELYPQGWRRRLKKIVLISEQIEPILIL